MIRGAETVHSTVVNRHLYRRLDENFSAAFRRGIWSRSGGKCCEAFLRGKVTLGKSDPRWGASAGCDREAP